jgi:small subunit ribosomal protein S17
MADENSASADAEALENNTTDVSDPAEEPVADEPAAEVEPEPAAEPAADAEAEEPRAEVEPATEQLVAEEPTEAAADAAAAAEPVSSSASAKRKRKRLPRSLRPPRTKQKREKPAERKPITRLPKPEHARGRRQERQGTVVSAAADKTIVVRVDTVKAHPTYKKVIRRSTKLHAHDEGNQAKVGDIVRIVETRPLSRMKRWRLQEIVEAAK